MQVIRTTAVVRERGYSNNGGCSRMILFEHRRLFEYDVIRTTAVFRERGYSNNGGCSRMMLFEQRRLFENVIQTTARRLFKKEVIRTAKHLVVQT